MVNGAGVAGGFDCGCGCVHSAHDAFGAWGVVCGFCRCVGAGCVGLGCVGVGCGFLVTIAFLLVGVGTVVGVAVTVVVVVVCLACLGNFGPNGLAVRTDNKRLLPPLF